MSFVRRRSVHRRSPHRAVGAVAVLVALAAVGSACSVVGQDGGGDASTQVVLVTHDSFSLPKALIAKFESESGYRLKVESVGDAGALTNQLVLNQSDPLGDVSFGVDNTFGSRALAHDVFAPYAGTVAPGASAYDLPGDDEHRLTPVDEGDVCVNVDTAWFTAHHQTPPATLADLTEPAYKDLTVAESASSSSTGLAFLLATVAAEGDGWPTYWKALLANGLRLTDGWDQAYDVDFTASGGDRPIVVSYDSSPAFTVKDGASSTKALLDTCFRQIEYVGVLTHAKNVAGARALVDFMESEDVQKALPTSMYVFPVRTGTPLPTQWAKFAVQPTKPFAIDPERIDADRDTWLRQWTDLTTS